VKATDAVPIVITDTSILINLSHTGHIWLLGKTPGFRFVVPDEVLAEVTDPEQIQVVETALADRTVSRESIDSPGELELFAQLTQVLGSGESACLALASSRGWLVACDEKRVFLREAVSRLGKGRILNTPGLYVLWIRTGLLAVAEADAAKAVLEANRFKMSFSSFEEVV
jgi:predicted nucleic acid-binding protein